MKYLLDTNACITFLGQRNPVLNKHFSNVPAQDKIVRSVVRGPISIRRDSPNATAQDKIVRSVVRGELYYGVYKSQRPQINLLKIDSFLAHLPTLPFDDQAARVYGVLRADPESKGTPIGSNDLQIAAIALANHLTLVTHNTSEFSRVPNLMWEAWEV